MTDCITTGNTGSKFCLKLALYNDPIGIILSKDSFSMPAADFLNQSKWNEAINQQKVFPIMDIKQFIDQSTEAVYKEYENGERTLVRQGKYRFSAEFNKNEEQKKALQPFTGFTQKIFLVYANDVIRGRTTDSGINIEGFRISELLVEKERLNASGDTAAIPIMVDLKNYKDLNNYDYSRIVNFDVSELDGLTEVNLAQVGTATATSLTISIYGTVYGKNYAITGAVLSDFSITGTGTLDSVTDNGDGTFTFVTTGLINGDVVNLQDPENMTTQDLLIISSAPVTVTV